MFRKQMTSGAVEVVCIAYSIAGEKKNDQFVITYSYSCLHDLLRPDMSICCSIYACLLVTRCFLSAIWHMVVRSSLL